MSRANNVESDRTTSRSVAVSTKSNVRAKHFFVQRGDQRDPAIGNQIRSVVLDDRIGVVDDGRHLLERFPSLRSRFFPPLARLNRCSATESDAFRR